MKDFMELLTLYREPSMVGKGLMEAVITGRDFVRALLGEVLDEEDIAYTRRFDGVLEAVASGKDRLSEIAAHLHSRGLTPSPSTSHVMKYVNALLKAGLLERVEIWGKRRGSRYRHVSPLTDLIYWLNAKYGFFDIPLTMEFLQKAVKQRIPTLVERFVEALLAEVYGLKPVKILNPEIDVALIRFKKIYLVAEVKWKGRVKKEDVRKAESKLSAYPDARKVLVVPDKASTPETWLEVMDITDMVKLAKDGRKRLVGE
ncbi:MAG: hypothetical protein J7L55_02635 [Desulfurococcales archaeon]|nr:hypothetical protein [Desulfurococcales archaeon]